VGERAARCADESVVGGDRILRNADRQRRSLAEARAYAQLPAEPAAEMEMRGVAGACVHVPA
jgi:hypothetical protein